MSKIKKVLIILSTGFLIILFTNSFLELYAKISKQSIYAGFMGLSGKAYITGFFISYSFFITIALMIFGGKKKYHIWAWLLIPILLIQLVSPDSLIISALVALVAWIISQGILSLKKYVKK